MFSLTFPCRTSLSAGLLVILHSLAQSQTPLATIRLNQVGFYPNAPKTAVVENAAAGPFEIATADGKKVVYRGTLSESRPNAVSGKSARLADFSVVKTPGSYVVRLPGQGDSYAFDINRDVHRDVAIASLRGFYYQRMSTELPAKFAGQWARPAGHPDTRVLIHPSAASDTRPAGSVISSPRGWYDAGDYNKYIVNSGITTGTLLSLYEDFPAYCRGVKANLPESGQPGGVPDLLHETLWNLRWMLTMQDPADGGVYHKLTNPSFDGMVMPDKATKDRYVVQKSITAALNLAAVAAQAARVLRPFGKALPGLADSCLVASERAWAWAKQHPEQYYRQNAMNQQFDPDVTTGSYEDRDAADEWIWAACELYATTKNESYYTAVNLFPDENPSLPSWNQVRLLGYYTLNRVGSQLGQAGQKDLPRVRQLIVAFASRLGSGLDKQAYGTIMGQTPGDYIWGSSAVAANQGIALVQAYRITKDVKYRNQALTNLDYLLGRNATGYSFVTGFGDKRVMNPHHRPSVADGIVEPVPGLLSGGPNGRAPQQDKCQGYPANSSPDETFVDQSCSYASNEIAINWNAPLVYLAWALEATQ